MECGDYHQPPSIKKLTIWGIVELVLLGLLLINCIYGFVENSSLNSIWNFNGLVANGFEIAGIIFILISIWKEKGSFMKLGVLCLAVTVIISLVIFIISLFSKVNGSSIIHLILNCFLCYLLWIQSAGFTTESPQQQ